jgi:hypothetical protein
VEETGRATFGVRVARFALGPNHRLPMSRPVYRNLDDDDLADLILLIVCAITIVAVAYLIAPVVGG